MTWLGQRNSSYEPERFPEGEINGAQLTTIVTLDDRQFGRITGVNPGGGVIRKLTETIREVHLRIERGRNLGGRQCVLWMNEQGKVIASAVVINDSGEAESYWNKPHSLERFGGSPDVTTRHEYGMWSLGNHGAVRQTRNFIREHYVTEA